MSDNPSDPMTAMAQMAASLHEVFVSLTASGFTEWQACRILGVMLAEQGRQE